MDLQAEKAQLIKQLQEINDAELIIALRSLLNYSKGKEQAQEYSIETYNQDIDLAEKENANREVISHSDLMNSM